MPMVRMPTRRGNTNDDPARLATPDRLNSRLPTTGCWLAQTSATGLSPVSEMSQSTRSAP